MSYNIQIGVAAAHNPDRTAEGFDLDRIVEIIKDEDPDILALQEVDRFRLSL